MCLNIYRGIKREIPNAFEISRYEIGNVIMVSTGLPVTVRRDVKCESSGLLIRLYGHTFELIYEAHLSTVHSVTSALIFLN